MDKDGVTTQGRKAVIDGMSGAVDRLAKEIGAAEVGAIDDYVFACHWAKELATVVARFAPWRTEHHIAVEQWRQRIEWAENDDLPDELELVRREIHEISYDDGWATERTLAAMEAVTLTFCSDTRWMAESSANVWKWAVDSRSYNDIARDSMRAWQRQLFFEVLMIMNKAPTHER